MKIAIFCGSRSGNDTKFEKKVRELGKFFAQNNIDVVYGGGKVGLMGAIADSVLENGGKVYGVIPKSLEDKELAHKGLTQLDIVGSMHERKAKMAELADAFVALPGGPGTLDEIFESWTWAQLGYHTKPCAFFNMFGFYDSLDILIKKMTDTGFLDKKFEEAIILTNNQEELLSLIENYQAPSEKW
jgi:uncharacterized protein (TIGR00730 family)